MGEKSERAETLLATAHFDRISVRRELRSKCAAVPLQILVNRFPLRVAAGQQAGRHVDSRFRRQQITIPQAIGPNCCAEQKSFQRFVVEERFIRLSCGRHVPEDAHGRIAEAPLSPGGRGTGRGG